MYKNPLTVGGGARLGREGDRPTARDKGPGAGSPSSAIFHCRILRSLRSPNANLTFQGFVKLICRGKKIDHIFFSSVLVKFVALIMQTCMGLHLHSSHVPTMLEAGPASSGFGSIKKMGELVQRKGPVVKQGACTKSPRNIFSTSILIGGPNPLLAALLSVFHFPGLFSL